MLDAKTCRSHGEHCRELATKSTIPFVRDDLLRMAELWLRLAKERERQEQVRSLLNVHKCKLEDGLMLFVSHADERSVSPK